MGNILNSSTTNVVALWVPDSLPQIPLEENFRDLSRQTGFSTSQCRRFYRRWLTFGPNPRTGLVSQSQLQSRAHLEYVFPSGTVIRAMYRIFTAPSRHDESASDATSTPESEMTFADFVNCLALFRYPEKDEEYDVRAVNNLRAKAAFLFDIMDLDQVGIVSETDVRHFISVYARHTYDKYEIKTVARKMLGGKSEIAFTQFLKLIEFGAEPALLDLCKKMSVSFVRGFDG